MHDITLCVNANCPLRRQCYRATATPDERQPFAEFYYDKEKGCENFIEAKSKSQVQRLDIQVEKE